MKLISILILVTVFISCTTRRSDRERDSQHILTNHEIEEAASEILQKSIDYKNLQWFYMDTSKLIIINFTDHTFSHNISKFGTSVALRDSSDINHEAIHYFFIIEELDIDGDNSRILLRYPTQGAVAELWFKNHDKGWEIDDENIYEY